MDMFQEMMKMIGWKV